MIANARPETGGKLSSDGSAKLSKWKDVNVLHQELGHPGEDMTRATGKHMGLTLMGTFAPCEDCGIAKAKQTKIKKGVSSKSKIPGERIFIDISSPKTGSLGGKHHWLLVVDDCTDMTWSFFLKKKTKTSEKIISLIKDLKSKYEIVVKIVRCDNAGENLALQRACESEGLGISFELMAPGSPQQNGKVERKFATLYGRMSTMLHGSNIEGSLRHQLWAICEIWCLREFF